MNPFPVPRPALAGEDLAGAEDDVEPRLAARGRIAQRLVHHGEALEDRRVVDELLPDEADEAVSALLTTGDGVTLPEGMCLPFIPGRQFKAAEYVAIPFSGNRVVAGTSDGLLAIVSGGKVFSLGMVAENGPVRCMTANADRTILYGVAGDVEDLGTIFSYDDERGLLRLGMVNTEMPEIGDVAYMTCLTACALSPDGKYLAVGCAGRLGTVVIYRLE